MSAYTTIEMTRSQVKSMIHDKVEHMTDSELERIADIILEKSLHNVIILGE